MDDFRYGPHAPRLDVVSKKNVLKDQILQKHPRAKNMYTYVQSEFKESFGCTYNSRCAYCGVSMRVVPASCFEVDHIVCQDESKRDDDDRARYVHDLDNLALACSYCNRKKSNFPCQLHICVRIVIICKEMPDDIIFKNHFQIPVISFQIIRIMTV